MSSYPLEQKEIINGCYELSNYSELIEEIVQEARAAYKENDLHDVGSALEIFIKVIKFAGTKHKQYKKNSENTGKNLPFIKIDRVLQMSLYLIKIKADAKTVSLSLLQDCIYYQEEYIKEIERILPHVPASFISRKLAKIKEAYRNINNIHYTQQICDFFLVIAKDTRTILISLSYTLYQAEHQLDSLPQAEKNKFVRAVEHVFIPLAERIGAYSVQNRLQDLLFQKNRPVLYQSIQERLSFLKKNNQIDVENFIKELNDVISEGEDIEFRIEGREKTVYSIWKKMERKQIPFEKLFDIFAFRIITKTVRECYLILAKIHTKYRANSEEFCDYISAPKSNNYQSLHTIIYDKRGYTMEIQIRTEKMQEIAEFGFAAHWRYKHDWANGNSNIKEIALIDSFKNPEENEKNEYNYNEYLTKQIFCFTPKGEIISLPEEATALDFAFTIHTEMGAKALYAKINNQIAHLETKLNNGDQVKIIQSTNYQITTEWLKMATTSKAINEIKKFIRKQKTEKAVDMGRMMLLHHMNNKHIKYDPKLLEENLHEFDCEKIEDVFYKIGVGDISTEKIIEKALENKKNNHRKEKSSPFLFISKILKKAKEKKKNLEENENNLISIPEAILPTANIETKLAKCCYPIPGDEIIGFFSSSNQLEVHLTECNKIKHLEQVKNIMELSWSSSLVHNNFYICPISVVISNHVGSLASVLFCIAQFKINVVDVDVVNSSYNSSEVMISVETKGTDNIRRIVAKLEEMPNVLHCKRYQDDQLT